MKMYPTVGHDGKVNEYVFYRDGKCIGWAFRSGKVWVAERPDGTMSRADSRREAALILAGDDG